MVLREAQEVVLSVRQPALENRARRRSIDPEAQKARELAQEPSAYPDLGQRHEGGQTIRQQGATSADDTHPSTRPQRAN